jgi:hypothetical protein
MNSSTREEDFKSFHACLRIFGDALNPEEVGERLGLAASMSHAKGSPNSRAPLLWKESLWCLKSPLSSECDMADQLEWLLDTLEPKASLLEELSKHYKMDFFCGFASSNGQGGFRLDPLILARLAMLNIPLVLDLYPPQAEFDGADRNPSAVEGWDDSLGPVESET